MTVCTRYQVDAMDLVMRYDDYEVFEDHRQNNFQSGCEMNIHYYAAIHETNELSQLTVRLLSNRVSMKSRLLSLMNLYVIFIID